MIKYNDSYIKSYEHYYNEDEKIRFVDISSKLIFEFIQHDENIPLDLKEIRKYININIKNRLEYFTKNGEKK